MVLYDELPVYPWDLLYEEVPMLRLYDAAGLLKFVCPAAAALLLIPDDMLRSADTEPLYDCTALLTPDVTVPDACPEVPVDGLVAGRAATIPERLAVTLRLVEYELPADWLLLTLEMPLDAATLLDVEVPVLIPVLPAVVLDTELRAADIDEDLGLRDEEAPGLEPVEVRCPK